MNLFWKRIFRVLQPTSVFEKKLENVQTGAVDDVSDNAEYNELDKSGLEAQVHSPEFVRKKELYQTKKYKDTDENRMMRRYEKLLNNPDIQLYYETKNGAQLQEYLNFKSNPDTLDMKNRSIAEVSEKIEQLKQFEQSKAYRNYTQLHDSLVVREFEELRAKVSEPDFVQANAFWANPDRWETTREYRMEQRYRELAGEKPMRANGRSNTLLFRKYSRVKCTFFERFDWNKLDESRWSAGFHGHNPRLVGNYSFANEWQANNNGRNVSTTAGRMTLHTVQLPAQSLAWDEQKGFVTENFGFTADVIQTAATFRQRYGIFSAKVRCSGALHHALWLSGEKKLPHINLFYFDGAALAPGNAGQHKMDGVQIKGIPESAFFVYTLEWTPRALVWYVNNVEVHRTTENVPHEALYLGINSFIPKKMQPAAGTLEVEWIRVFEVRE